jgi:hypothetical protein
MSVRVAAPTWKACGTGWRVSWRERAGGRDARARWGSALPVLGRGGAHPRAGRRAWRDAVEASAVTRGAAPPRWHAGMAAEAALFANYASSSRFENTYCLFFGGARGVCHFRSV